MYSLISAIAKKITGDKEWVTPDLSNIPFNEIYFTYSKVYLILSNTLYTNNLSLDLDLLNENLTGSNMSVNEYLLLNDNKTLPTSNIIPNINKKYVKYADAFHAKYKITPVDPKSVQESNLPLSEKPWLKLTRKITDYNLFYKSCLVNVNGFFHQTDVDQNGVYVVDGMKSRNLSRSNHIGICSFRELGELSFIPITKTMLYKSNQDQSYKDFVNVNLGIDTTEYTLMLVLGGYLHILDSNTFYRTSSNTVKVNFKNIPFLERYYESKKYLDLTKLNLSKSKSNLEQVAISELFSDDTIEEYFSLSQSFFVLLNNKSISVKKIPIKKTPFPSRYIAYEKPNKLLITGLGKVTNYWYTHEVGQYSLACNDSDRNNYDFQTIDPMNVISVSNAKIPYWKTDPSIAYMLEISTISL